MNNEYPSPNTLAHELVAREEQSVGIFFAAFAIQYYVHKDMLTKKINVPTFLKFFSDIELYASQRVLIKDIINNKKYKFIVLELEKLLLDYNADASRLPYETFLNKIYNKAFLIRQIFEHTNQTLSKYSIIKDYINIELINLDLNELADKMANFTNEEKILMLIRIFIQQKDAYESKKKEIMDSFLENIQRKKEEYKLKNKTNSIEYTNLENFFNKYNKN